MVMLAARPSLRRLAPLLLAAVAGPALLAACSKAPSSSAEIEVLVDRAAIEDLPVDYYSQIGSSNDDYSAFFTVDGALDMNGLTARGNTEIEALYRRAGGGGAGEAPPRSEDSVPPGRFHMLFSNYKPSVGAVPPRDR